MIKSKHGDRPTLGSRQNAVSQMNDYSFVDIEDMARHMSNPERLEAEVWKMVDAYRKEWPNKDGYIQLNIIKDKLVPYFAKEVWAARTTCPDPFFNETVWKYDAHDDSVELLWTIPDPDSCKDILSLKEYAREYEKVLVRFITEFKNGTLQALSNKLNKITDKTPYLLDTSYLKSKKVKEH